MAQQCFHNEYFDSLLHACKPCHLRCPDTPPVMCQRYCNTRMTSFAKGTNTILWTCLGLTLVASLALFVLMFLLRKMSSEVLKNKFQSPVSSGLVLLDMANTDLDKNKTDNERILPRSLGYTVEECTCDDCAKSNPKIDSDHLFPLPAMEEGSTILVTTKTSDYSKSMPVASESVTGIEKPIHSR
ncbi:tumor necrosis factor receptor superfamily member 17 [Nannospalax galili]|uniref:tumor necrosis factor receptor superfamily member 17 n=1 Tax=Nannospalax galili TaxID=1026970 RepID=UPI00081A1A54|nr:tumor necrosis factor receptor superfamily member 17 [Nannospalax galili]